MIEPHFTETGISFFLRCDERVRQFLISTQALRMLGRRHGFIMDYMNLYRAHEASIHVVARYLALNNLRDDPIRLEMYDFPANRVSGIGRSGTERSGAGMDEAR